MAADARSARRKSLANSLVTTVAVLAGLVLVNVVCSRVSQRIDLSGAGLTRASELMVGRLDEPLQVTAYFGKIPAENAYEQEYVEQLLESYADASDGKLQWKKIDPFERGKEFQQKLRADEGIDKLMWLSVVDDVPQQVPVYFHVQFKYLDKTEIWQPPGRFSLTGLEYQFSSIIKRLAFPKKKVGVTQGFGSPERAGAITAILSGNFDVVPVDLSNPEANLADLDLLIVNGPTQPLDQNALLAIDNHILAGRSTLFLLRGMAFTTPQAQPGMPVPDNQPYMGMPTQSGLESLLGHHGILIRNGIVLDRRASTPGALFIGQRGLLVRELFPLVEVLAGGDGDALQGMSIIPMPFASTVELSDDFDDIAGGRIEAQVLARSSAASYARSSVIAITKEANLARTEADRGGPLDIGYALVGKFTSFMAASAPAQSTTDDAQVSPAGTRMIVLGSADFASDQVLSMAQQHPMFRELGTGVAVLQNLVDWLVHDQSLVAARNKGAPPPIAPLGAGTKRWIKYGNTAGVAIALLLAGLVAWIVRERRRRHVSL